MSCIHRSKSSVRYVSAFACLALAALLLAAKPAVSLAASGQEAGGRSSISGAILAESGSTLAEVVITLEPVTGSTATGQTTPEGRPDGATLINRGGHFVPELLVVPAGTTITFRNGDRQFHTAELSSAGRLLSHLVLLADGPEFGYTFAAPGVTAVRDWMNPGRDPAYIVVPETRYFDISNGHGQFAIRDIPAGTYTLRAWHMDLGSRAFPVTVADGSEAHIAFSLESPRIAELSPARPSASPSAEAKSPDSQLQ